MNWIEISIENQAKINEAILRKPIKIFEQGKDICVVKTDEGIFGVNNSCPHAGAQLHHGHCNKLDVISCPLHGYKFQIKNGRSTDGNNYKLICYEFKFEEGIYFLRRKN
ncbi:MAG: Rieske 2Fe-2S domain-containing protein [Sphingobacteriales bacterium]|nr:MAG: Rieske 2Fe-2S domain-containing protein [Sphingobacteriales bacterium]